MIILELDQRNFKRENRILFMNSNGSIQWDEGMFGRILKLHQHIFQRSATFIFEPIKLMTMN